MTDLSHGKIPVKAVLFDLDGTLADTAPDLAYALNETLRHFGHRPLRYEKIRPVVSYGGMALIKLGFGIEPSHPEFENYRQFLLDVYEKNICKETRLFDGMENLIQVLEQNQVAWGIVTNKPAWLTDPLMMAMKLNHRAATIISGDTCQNNKPHPEPILCGCKEAGVLPEETVYIGDAERDIEAGRSAGCMTAAALFGYIQEEDEPALWQADINIQHPIDLLDHIYLVA